MLIEVVTVWGVMMPVVEVVHMVTMEHGRMLMSFGHRGVRFGQYVGRLGCFGRQQVGPGGQHLAPTSL